MLGHAHASPIESDKTLSMHGSASPEVMRPNLAGGKSRAGQLQQYQSPQEMNPSSYSPATNPSSGTYSGTASSNGGEKFPQSNNFIKRSNSDSVARGHESATGTPNTRPQRHASFGMSDSKSADFQRPPLQTTVGPYGLLSSASSNQNYHSHQNSPQPFVNQQNLTPFTLPPPGFSTSVTAASSTRSAEQTYPTSMSTEYPSEPANHQQSGSDMMLLDQMTAPNTMPVFGGDGYTRSPFAIPEDFVAYLFSGQQIDNSSPVQMGQQGFGKSVFLSFSDIKCDADHSLAIRIRTASTTHPTFRTTLVLADSSQQIISNLITLWRLQVCLILASRNQFCLRRRAKRLSI